MLERMGKMPELPRVTMAPFAQTRQTLPVLLDRRGPTDDSQVEIAERAIREGFAGAGHPTTTELGFAAAAAKDMGCAERDRRAE
jgi:hypothetical protein